MNDYIMQYILKYIISLQIIKNKNLCLNTVEEYIEWLNFAMERFDVNHTYVKYIANLQKYQSYLLLNEFDNAKMYLEDLILFYSISRNDINE